MVSTYYLAPNPTTQLRTCVLESNLSNNADGRGNAVSDVSIRQISFTENISSLKAFSLDGKEYFKINRSNKSRTFASSQDVTELENIPTPTPKSVEPVEVEFILKEKCFFGQSFWITGNGKSLGQWKVEDAVALKWNEEDTWVAKVKMPAGATKEFKYILKDSNGKVTWQPGPNRTLQVENGVKEMKVICPWGEESIDSQPEIIKISENKEFTDGFELAKDEEESSSDISSRSISSNESLNDSSNGSIKSSTNGSSNVSTNDSVAAKSTNGAAKESVSSSGSKVETKNVEPNSSVISSLPEEGKKSKKASESVFERDAKWLLWNWTSLLSSLGRKSLMDEESSKEKKK